MSVFNLEKGVKLPFFGVGVGVGERVGEMVQCWRWERGTFLGLLVKLLCFLVGLFAKSSRFAPLLEWSCVKSNGWLFSLSEKRTHTDKRKCRSVMLDFAVRSKCNYRTRQKFVCLYYFIKLSLYLLHCMLCTYLPSPRTLLKFERKKKVHFDHLFGSAKEN